MKDHLGKQVAHQAQHMSGTSQEQRPPISRNHPQGGDFHRFWEVQGPEEVIFSAPVSRQKRGALTVALPTPQETVSRQTARTDIDGRFPCRQISKQNQRTVSRAGPTQREKTNFANSPADHKIQSMIFHIFVSRSQKKRSYFSFKSGYVQFSKENKL